MGRQRQLSIATRGYRGTIGSGQTIIHPVSIALEGVVTTNAIIETQIVTDPQIVGLLTANPTIEGVVEF